jgi:arabinogalactan endo-1,4-beta-galactosidase
MSDLKSAGIFPEWVQIGNEINPGMLLPDGSSSNMANLSQLINQGYCAINAVSSKSRVIVHLSSGSDNALLRWFFDGLTQNSGKFDVIGLSYYPYWDKVNYKDNIDALAVKLNDMSSRNGKEVMVVETGGLDNQIADIYNLVSGAIEKVRAVPGGKGLGILSWEPEGASLWSGYGRSCWGSNGKPTSVLDAFLK